MTGHNVIKIKTYRLYIAILCLFFLGMVLGNSKSWAQTPSPTNIPSNFTLPTGITSNVEAAKILQNPAVTSLIQQTLQSSGGGAAVQQIQEILTQVSPASVLGNPQALAQLGVAALQQVAPELTNALSAALGGNLAGALSTALGSPIAQQKALQKKEEEQKEQAANATEGCSGCGACANCPIKINENHVSIRTYETSSFEAHRSWLVTTWWVELVAPALAAMTSQFTANMMLQVEAIGAFFDAKHQLETQRLFQHLTAKAHKDYHPSEELCVIGTNTRSLTHSERKTNLVHTTLANRMMQRQLSQGTALSTTGEESDRLSRLRKVLDTYCRPTDNGGFLNILCKATKKERMNMDVDYTSAMENKLTLNLNFSDGKESDVTEDEENILSLGTNLFAHDVIKKIPIGNLGKSPQDIYDMAYYYLDYRAIAAKRGVAQNSFAAIAALKAEGDESENATGPFLKAILTEAGVNPNDIEKRLGKNPSYFAQMEVMTKDIYQNPQFYSDLYDKPVNIERKSAALQAIELMQDRDIYQSLMRSEAVLATLVETLLAKEHERISGKLQNMSSGQ